MGRPPMTGRFATREELVAFVLQQYHTTPRKVPDIARAAQVSEAIVHRILNRKNFAHRVQ
jgi:hypothetical protein